jgi:nitrogen fixation NifU-like protein
MLLSGGTLFSDSLLDHFRNPRNAGSLPAPAVCVRVENPVCGDILELSARAEEGRIAEVRFQVRGCTASIACGSATTTLLEGVAVAEMARVDAASIEAAVGGLESASKHAARLCADGVKALAAALPETR